MPDRPRHRKRWTVFAVLGSVGALVATGVVMGVTSSGSNWLADRLLPDGSPIEGTAEAWIPSGAPVFVADATPPLPSTMYGFGENRDWDAFTSTFDASASDAGFVEVVLQGSGDKAVVLTNIQVDVISCQTRPAGATYSRPIGDGLVGRYMVFDLDSDPPVLQESGESASSLIGDVVDTEGNPLQPITFPWTVSASDPLVLEVIAQTARQDCLWSITVKWKSGNAIQSTVFDNSGQGFRVVGSQGLKNLYSNDDGTGWQDSPS